MLLGLGGEWEITELEFDKEAGEERNTNAYMEGRNNMFQMVKRKARGYRSDEHFIMMIYFVGSKLTLPASTPSFNAK